MSSVVLSVMSLLQYSGNSNKKKTTGKQFEDYRSRKTFLEKGDIEHYQLWEVISVLH